MTSLRGGNKMGDVGGTCRIHVLGRFDAEVDGRPVSGRLRRGVPLVKLLALEPTHHLLRDEVMRHLWPSLQPRDAEGELRKAVKDVQQSFLDGRAVTVEGERLRLWPHGSLWVDAHAFAASAKHARNEEQVAAAIALYRGDLLPEDADVTWTLGLRTRLRLTYLELLRDPNSGTTPWIDVRNPAPLSLR